MNYLDVHKKRVLVEYDLNESCEEQSDAFKTEHSSLILLVVCLSAESYHCVAPTNELADLKNHYQTEDYVSVLEEGSMLFENFD